MTNFKKIKQFINKFTANKLEENYIDYYDWAPKWPFRLYIIGKPGSGKSTFVLNLILDGVHWDKIYLYTKTPEEDKYLALNNFIEEYKKQASLDESPITISNNFENVVNLDDLDKYQQNLIIIDGCHKPTNDIYNLLKECRKLNTSIIFLGHNFFDSPKNIRNCCNYFVLFEIDDNRDVKEISDHISLDKVEFLKIYRNAIKQSYGFLLIDKNNKNPKLKYRKMFDINEET